MNTLYSIGYALKDFMMDTTLVIPISDWVSFHHMVSFIVVYFLSNIFMLVMLTRPDYNSRLISHYFLGLERNRSILRLVLDETKVWIPLYALKHMFYSSWTILLLMTWSHINMDNTRFRWIRMFYVPLAVYWDYHFGCFNSLVGNIIISQILFQL